MSSLPNSYTLHHTTPSPTEYLNLRTVTGLTPPPLAAIPFALSSSVHAILIRFKPSPLPAEPASSLSDSSLHPPSSPLPNEIGLPVAMARLVGDGHLVLQLTDMCVHPDHQRKGLGTAVLHAMMDWIDQFAKDAYVSLIADPGPAEGLYRAAGFLRTEGVGMKRSTWGR